MSHRFCCHIVKAQSRQSCLWLILLVASVASVALWSCLTAAPAQARSLVGSMVYAQGDVTLQPGDEETWRPVAAGDDVLAGDVARTGADSRAAVLCVDESQIKLNANTIMRFTASAASSRLVAPAAASRDGDRVSRYAIEAGEAWLRNSKEDFDFELSTPALTAAIRGTEFTVRVEEDGATTIALLQGELLLSNPFGELSLFAGEVGFARPGEAPSKRVLVDAEGAVQWTLYYPGVVSLQDLQLAGLDEATAAGWDALRRHQPRQALEAFATAPRGPQGLRTPQAAAGYALALFRTGDAAGAYASFRPYVADILAVTAAGAQAGELAGCLLCGAAAAAGAAALETPLSPNLTAVGGFLALMAGRVEEAERLFAAALARDPQNVLALSWRAQMALAMNDKAEARRLADQALAADGESPLALVSSAVTAMAEFELPKARAALEAALEADPQFVPALLYLTRLQLGAEELYAARETARRALAIAPMQADALAMAGFVRLAFREFDEADEYFTRAIRSDARFGDPHLGLGQSAFARGEEPEGLRRFLLATLLDPRISLYQATLGKAFYEAEAFDKALATYDYAQELDPDDPTPHLYKGIALTDLNRPGEAVEEINQSIRKNDNRAVFRTRLMLDRDLAVRNYDLARAYIQLGLGEWVVGKALQAVRTDPLNSSARLFLSNALSAGRQRVGAAGSELLLFLLLSPANQNTFTLFNDYTPMFETPYLRLSNTSAGGAWSSGNGFFTTSTELSGGLPGFAGSALTSYTYDGGIRDSNGDLFRNNHTLLLKWDGSPSDSFSLSVNILNDLTGDIAELSSDDYENSQHFTQHLNAAQLELGWVHRFSPTSRFLAYGFYRHAGSNLEDRTYESEIIEPGFPSLETATLTSRDAPLETFSFQTQYQLALQQTATGDHTFLAGLEFYEGVLRDDLEQEIVFSQLGEVFQTEELSHSYDPPERSFSVYVLDTWRVTRDLVIDARLSYDYVEASRLGFIDSIEKHQLSPRLGLTWEATEKDTFRIAAQRYLNTSLGLNNTLQPSTTAGFFSQLNADSGSSIVELGAAWERQWNDKTYSIVQADFLRVENPQYDFSAGYDREVILSTNRSRVLVAVNRILTPWLGASVGASIKRLHPDTAAARFFPEFDYFEVNARANLVARFESGLFAGLGGSLVHQHFYDGRATALSGGPKEDQFFSTVDASIGYEFPGKRGFVSCTAENIFDTRFNYQLEPVTLETIVPARRVLFQLGLYF